MTLLSNARTLVERQDARGTLVDLIHGYSASKMMKVASSETDYRRQTLRQFYKVAETEFESIYPGFDRTPHNAAMAAGLVGTLLSSGQTEANSSDIEKLACTAYVNAQISEELSKLGEEEYPHEAYKLAEENNEVMLSILSKIVGVEKSADMVGHEEPARDGDSGRAVSVREGSDADLDPGADNDHNRIWRDDFNPAGKPGALPRTGAANRRSYT